MHDPYGMIQRLPERGEVEVADRVDAENLLRCGYLQKAELGEVGGLTHELRVETYPLLPGQCLTKSVQAPAVNQGKGMHFDFVTVEPGIRAVGYFLPRRLEDRAMIAFSSRLL